MPQTEVSLPMMLGTYQKICTYTRFLNQILPKIYKIPRIHHAEREEGWEKRGKKREREQICPRGLALPFQVPTLIIISIEWHVTFSLKENRSYFWQGDYQV